MEFKFGQLTFTSKFDSGNLAKVDKISRNDDDDDEPSSSQYYSLITSYHNVS